MRKLTTFFLFLFQMSMAFGQESTIPVLNFAELEPRLHCRNDTVYVVNFWATWCKPCVEELPFLEQLTQEYGDQPVKVLLVSLDFKSQLASRLVPFIQMEKIESEVVLLYDLDADSWIPKVNEQWDGAIPVTLIYRGDRRAIHLEPFENYADLKNFVSGFLR